MPAEGVDHLARKRLLVTAYSFEKMEPSYPAKLEQAGFSLVAHRESPTLDQQAFEAGIPQVERRVTPSMRPCCHVPKCFDSSSSMAFV